MRSNHLFAGVLLLAALPCLAAAPAPASQNAKSPSTFFRNAPLPKWIAPLAAVPPTRRTDPVVVRLAETQAWTGPKPAVLVHRAVQVNEKTSLTEIGQYGVSYFPAYQKLHLHRVAILRGDQVIDRTASVNTRLLEREPSLESGFYVGETTVQLLLDDVRAGDTLQIIYTTEGRNPVFARLWADEFSWEQPRPVEQRRLTILHPLSQKLYWRELGDAKPASIVPVIERSGAVERMRFEENGMEAFEPEQSIPSSFFPVRMIQTSEYGSWQEVAAWAAGLFSTPPASPALSALARQFASAKTEEERASAALHWVQDEIRYFSVSLGENSHRPQMPDTVLKRRFGDCKDKTSLLIALLAQLGIKAEPVLVNAKSPELPGKMLPTPTWFDHVIVRVHADGKTYYVDPTRESERGLLSQLPSAIPGAAALVVAVGTTALSSLPEAAAGFPWLETRETFTVDDLAGDAQLEVSSIYRGQYARYARLRYAAMSAADLRKDMLGDYDKQFRGAALLGLPTKRDSDDGAAFTVSARLTLPKPVVVAGEHYSLAHKTHILDGTLGIPDKLTRVFPFELPYGRYQARYRMRIIWPRHVKLVHAGDAQTIDNPFFRAHKEFAWRGNEVDYVLDYAVKRKQLAAVELPELEVQSKLLLPLIESSLRFDTGATVQPKAVNFSIRDSTAANAVATIQALAQSLSKGDMQPNADTVNALCDSALDSVYLRDIYRSMRASTDVLLQQIASFKGLETDKQRCKARFAFDAGNFKEALGNFAKGAPVGDGDVQLLDIAWARLASGDVDRAMVDTQRFVQARLKAGALAPDDAVLAVLLLQRGGQALPAELEAYTRAVPDAPWPRPLFEFLAGRMSQQQLLDAAGQFAPIKRESALNEAWFYIAARLRLEGKPAQALQALRWFPINGIYRSRTETLARSETVQLTPSDPDLSKGLEVANAKPSDFKAAREYYLKAAGRGIAAAETELGFLARHGKAGKADPAEAFKWYRRAAEQGDVDAMNDLANAYAFGTGVEKNEALAVEWYQRAAAPGHYYASRNLGKLYRYGKGGLPLDKKRAFEHLHNAAQLGNAEAQSMVAAMYFEAEGVDKDWTLALYWAARSMDQGDANGKVQFAFMLAHGHGVEKNLARAIALWRQAAEEGNEAGQVQLASAYLSGTGVKQSDEEAFAWFSKAALQGNILATKHVGMSLLRGYGVAAAPEKARLIFNILVKENVPDGHYWLGKMAAEGLDGPVDKKLAERLFKLCGEAGDADCQASVGTSLQFGATGVVDVVEAAAWYKKAAAQGHLGAINNLADMHEKGTGMPVDIPLAISMYRKAAQNGYATALFSLGELNELGKGVPADAYLAYLYYELARMASESRGHADSERMAAKLGAADIARAQAWAKAWRPPQALPDEAAGTGHAAP